MNSKRENQLKSKIHGKVNVHIGKSGITMGVIEEIKNQLKKKKMIKIRFLDLAGFEKTENAAKNISELTKSEVLDVRGNTCVIGKFK